MAGREIIQKVIDFQFSRTKMKEQHTQYFFDQKSKSSKFTNWNLQKIINGLGLLNKSPYQIKWVGCDQNSHIDAFIYCLFKGSKSSSAEQNGIFIKLKYSIYQLTSKFLKLNDQKKIIQTLCSAEYTKNLSQFLNKNKFVSLLFEKLIKSYLQSLRIQYQSQIDDLKLFAKNFSFVKFQTVQQNVASVQILGQKFYIINQKSCFFIIQADSQEKSSSNFQKTIQSEKQTQYQIKLNNQALPHFATNQKKLKTESSKKFFQYSAPRFIAQGLAKKKKRQARYTEFQIDYDNGYENGSSIQQSMNQIKTIDPIMRTHNDILTSQKQNFQKVRSITPKNFNSENPQLKSKSQQKYNKQLGKRGGKLVESTENESKNQEISMIESNLMNDHDITFDEKQTKKNSLKKIQLNFKKLIQSKNKSKTNLGNTATNISKNQSAFKRRQQINSSSSLNPPPTISYSSSQQRLITYH